MQLPTHYEELAYITATINAFGDSLPYDHVMELLRDEAQMESEFVILPL